MPKLIRKNLFQKISVYRALALILFFAMPTLQLAAQQQNSKYNIKRNGEIIGQLSFLKKEDGDDIFLKMTSKVNTRFVFKINVETEDMSHFKNGKLITSGVSRIVNGDEKEHKRTSLQQDAYQILAGKKTSVLKQRINYNMMLLYTKEPINIDEVYSDNFQCFVPIKKSGDHKYRITLPDGNYNDYHFQDGICKLIIINQSFYSIRMELV